MRRLAWLVMFAATIALSIYATPPISGQQQQPQAMPRQYGTPPPMVITAFGGKPVTYKAPRTPWGDPDLQGVWSSDDMDGVGTEGRGGGRGRGGPGAPTAPAAAAPAGPPPLYLTDEQLEARRKQVADAADNRDKTATSTFRNDYGRRAFPQTRLLVDPPDGRLPAVRSEVPNRLMPRGTFG